jgi:porphobilinogen synthase
MVRETGLSPDDFIYPMFVTFGRGVKKKISSMPGCFQMSVDEIVKEAGKIHKLGIPAIILFGIPEHKDEQGSEAYSAKGVVQKAVRAIKDKVPELIIVTDVCMCEYMSHGHCGVIKKGKILNDPTLELLAREALSLISLLLPT